jgi:hypothetical protein
LVYLQLSCKPRRLPFSGENIMRYLLFTLFFVLILLSTTSAQTRQQALQDIANLKEQAGNLEKIILSPDKQDIELAEKEKVNVFRILPREKYDNSFSTVRGGGAYYSFTKQSHSYNEIPQIELQGNQFSVGFAGFNCGLMSDLGEISLAEVGEKTNGFSFLMEYKPVTNETEGRIESRRFSAGFKVGEVVFNRRLPAIVGHSYFLRAISYDQADVMVTFKVQRKDADGSLILLWKLIKQFDNPVTYR